MDLTLSPSFEQEVRIHYKFVGSVKIDIKLNNSNEIILLKFYYGRVRFKRNTYYFEKNQFAVIKMDRLDETTPYSILLSIPKLLRMQISSLESDHPRHELTCHVYSKRKIPEEDIIKMLLYISPPRPDMNRVVIYRKHTLWIQIQDLDTTLGGLLLIPKSLTRYKRFMFRIMIRNKKPLLFLENSTNGIVLTEPVGVIVNHLGWIGLSINQELMPITEDGDPMVDFVQVVLEHAAFKYTLEQR